MFTRAKVIVFGIIPVLVLFLVLELGINFYKRLFQSYGALGSRYSNPAYTTKPWFNSDFLKASNKQPGGWFRPEGTRLIFPSDYQDKFFTVKDGVRRTVGFTNDENYFRGQFWLVGGSTTYCSEVPDEFTWASHLQQMLNKSIAGAQIEVLNFGVTSVNSVQELERLEFELKRRNRPLIVVFFDGVNDVIQGVLYNDFKGTLYETLNERQDRGIPKLRKMSDFIDFAIDVAAGFLKTKPYVPTDVETLESRASQASEFYLTNIMTAHKECKSRGIEFYCFLQPCLFTINRELTAHEQHIFGQAQNGAYYEAFRHGYPKFQEVIKELKRYGVKAFDLSDIFDANYDPIFLDFCHVESGANRLIAQSIFNIITSQSRIISQNNDQEVPDGCSRFPIHIRE